MAQSDATKSATAVIKAISSIDYDPNAFALVFDYKATDAVSAQMFETMIALCKVWAAEITVKNIGPDDPFYNQAIYAMRIIDALAVLDVATANATSNRTGRHL